MKIYILNKTFDLLFDPIVEVFLGFDLELWWEFLDQITILSLNILGEEKEPFEELLISLVLMKELGDKSVEVFVFPSFWGIDHVWLLILLLK